MNRLHRIGKSRDTLSNILHTLKEVGFEKLIILSNTGSHTYSRCRIQDIGEAVKIETGSGEHLIFFDDIKYVRLSYKNTVCLFETCKRGRQEYRAENWFLMNSDQYRDFSIRIG